MTNYKTDIEIAQECEMKDIASVAEKIGIGEESLKRYGNHIAKINLDYVNNKIVAYKNPHKPVNDPYNLSAYSGMMFNGYI